MKLITMGLKGKSILIAVLLIAVIFTAMNTVSADSTVDFSVRPSTQTVSIGQTFTVGIYVDPDGNEMDSLSTDWLWWDHSIMKLESISVNNKFVPGTTAVIIGQSNYTAMPPSGSNSIPVGGTKVWNYTLPYNLNLCDGLLTTLRIPAGTYGLKINGKWIVNITGAPLSYYNLNNWISAGAQVAKPYVNITIKNNGGSGIAQAYLYMRDSNKRFLGYSNIEAQSTSTPAYFANLTFKALANGICTFHIASAAAVLSGSNYPITITNGTVTVGYAPIVSSPSPANQTTGVNPRPVVSAYLTDPDGGSHMNIWINVTNADGGATSDSWTSVGNGTRTISGAHQNAIATFGKRYNWTVQANDGTFYTTKSYWFTLRSQYIPSAPSGFTATPISTSQINLAWTKGTSASTTYVEAKQGSYPASRTDGTNVYNSTGSSYPHTGLSTGQHWYYRAWSFNSVDMTWSSSYAEANGWTLNNTAPSLGTPSPTNGSIGQPISFSWSIPITDAQGDSISWTIQCSNGQQTSGSGGNGTKSLSVGGLAYSTSYRVYVNATDAGGSGQYTRRWYTFTTIANQPPVFGTPTPANGTGGQELSFTWSISITDPESESISWTIQCSNGQSTSGGAGGGVKSIAIGGLLLGPNPIGVYTVFVNATDTGSGQTTRRWYTFDTKDLGLATGGGATAVGRFQLDLVWTKGTNADRTIIEWRTTPGSWSRGAGNPLCNSTGTTWGHTGRDPGTTYYYRAWSYSTVTNQYTATSAYFSQTTVTNNDPALTGMVPTNETENVSLSYNDYSINISDAEGDHMTLIIRGGPSWGGSEEVYNETGLTNGTIIPDAPSLPMPDDTTIYVWIFLYDGYDWTNKTYWFKTGAIIDLSLDLFYLNSTKTGYNFIAELYDEPVDASELAEYLTVGVSIAWERIEYWNVATQEYAPAYYDGPGAIEHTYNPGDVILITVLENGTMDNEGFSPTMDWQDIAVAQGTNWFGRTGFETTAYDLGFNLTHYGIDWAQFIYYDPETQSYSDAFLPAYGSGSIYNFHITPGLAVFVATNETGAFRMFGW